MVGMGKETCILKVNTHRNKDKEDRRSEVNILTC